MFIVTLAVRRSAKASAERRHCFAIDRIPFANWPSHVSAPVYVPVIIPAVALDAEPLSVALHAGVGSPDAPAANDIVSVIAVPAIVPVIVPLLLR